VIVNRHRRLTLALITAILIIVPSIAPVATAGATPGAQRCAEITNAVNARRTPADLRILAILCRVAERRAYDMVVNGYFAHDTRPAQRALTAAGIKWCKVGEALAWRSVWQTSTRWATDWWGSAAHRQLLNDPQYDFGAGSYTGVRSYYPHAVAVYYTVDLC
jgi:uncharacterized protein YkwD